VTTDVANIPYGMGEKESEEYCDVILVCPLTKYRINKSKAI